MSERIGCLCCSVKRFLTGRQHSPLLQCFKTATPDNRLLPESAGDNCCSLFTSTFNTHNMLLQRAAAALLRTERSTIYVVHKPTTLLNDNNATQALDGIAGLMFCGSIYEGVDPSDIAVKCFFFCYYSILIL